MPAKEGMPIPDDWNGVDYSIYMFCAPNSVLWNGVVKGALFELTRGRNWDRNTGVIKDAQAVGWEVFDSMSKCDELVTVLGEIRDAINNQSLTTYLDQLESLLQSVESAISGLSINLDTTPIVNILTEQLDGVIDQIDNVQQELVTVSANTQNVADRVDDAGTDIVNLASSLAVDLGNLAALLTSTEAGYANAEVIAKLVDLDDVLERTLVYMGTQTTFYGQTMTTQTEALHELRDAIQAQQMDFTVIAREDYSPVDVTGYTPVGVAGEKLLNALTVHKLIHKSLLAFDGTVPDTVLWPSSMRQAIVDNTVELALAFIGRQGFQVVELGARVADTATATGIPWSWSAIAAEWLSLEESWMCYIYGLPDPTTEADMVNKPLGFIVAEDTASQALEDAMSLILAFDSAIYIWNEYLGGDKSRLYSEFYLLREQLRDGFDASIYDTICT